MCSTAEIRVHAFLFDDGAWLQGRAGTHQRISEVAHILSASGFAIPASKLTIVREVLFACSCFGSFLRRNTKCEVLFCPELSFLGPVLRKPPTYSVRWIGFI